MVPGAGPPVLFNKILTSLFYNPAMDPVWYVYMMADHPGGLLYVGITNDLLRRVEEHKSGIVDGFTKKYQIHCLIYYETFLRHTTPLGGKNS